MENPPTTDPQPQEEPWDFFKAHLHLKRILKLNEIVYEFTFRVLINCGTEDTLT